MKLIKKIYQFFESKIIVFLGTLMVLFPGNPINSKFAFRDSGVFLYTGWRILEGEIPYVEIWDHKPPIIFFINAFGLWLSNNSRWGIWIIEFVCLFTAAYFGYKLLRDNFGKYSAIISSFIWLYSLTFMIGNGNFTEEYVLPLQFLTLFLFYYAQHKKSNNLIFIIIGLLNGVAFFTKQSSIGIWVSIAIYILIIGIIKGRIKSSLKTLFFIMLGFLIITTIICGYLYFNGALKEFWDAAFIYNFNYSLQSAMTINIRLWNLLNVNIISKMGLFQFSALGLVLFITLFKKWRNYFEGPKLSLLIVGAVNIPLEILFINIPGRTYEHYFMTILPSMALFTCFLLFLVNQKISQFSNLLRAEKIILIISSLGVLAFSGINGYWSLFRSLQEKTNEEVIQYVIENSDQNDTILIWGAESMINFYSQRKSPTKYVYQYPLYKNSYTSEEKINEFLNEIIDSQPKYIINSMRVDYPIFQFPLTTVEIKDKLDFIESIYIKVDEVSYWDIYKISLD